MAERKLLDEYRERLRVKHYRLRTEDAYPRPSSGLCQALYGRGAANAYNATAQRGNPMNTHSSSRLRELLARPGWVVAPGVVDTLAARLVARAGL